VLGICTACVEMTKGRGNVLREVYKTLDR